MCICQMNLPSLGEHRAALLCFSAYRGAEDLIRRCGALFHEAVHPIPLPPRLSAPSFPDSIIVSHHVALLLVRMEKLECGMEESSFASSARLFTPSESLAGHNTCIFFLL